MERVKAKVTGVRLLTDEESALIEEIKEQRSAALANVRDSFRHLITLSVSVLSLEIALVEFADHRFGAPLTAIDWLIIVSLAMLFLSAFLAFAGQTAELTRLPTLDLLAEYRHYKESRLQKAYPIYAAASLLFGFGLAAFALSMILKTG